MKYILTAWGLLTTWRLSDNQQHLWLNNFASNLAREDSQRIVQKKRKCFFPHLMIVRATRTFVSSDQFQSIRTLRHLHLEKKYSREHEPSDQQECGTLCSLPNYQTGKTNLSEMRCGWAIDLFIQSTYFSFPQHLLALPAFLRLWHATAGVEQCRPLTSWRPKDHRGAGIINRP